MKYSTLLVSVVTFGMAYAGFTCGSISYSDDYCRRRVNTVGGYDFEPESGDFAGTPPYIRVPLKVQSASGNRGEGSDHWVVVDANNNIVGAVIYGVLGYTKCS